MYVHRTINAMGVSALAARNAAVPFNDSKTKKLVREFPIASES